MFGNPQHSYTQSLLTAVPQLHRRWGSAVDPALGAVAVNGPRAGRQPVAPALVAKVDRVEARDVR